MMGAGRYRVDKLLGRGGMGSVFAVTDVVSGERLALKRLHDAQPSARAAASLHREYERLAELQHPSIIRVFDYGQDADGPYYTMELLSGASLSERGRLSAAEACRMLRDVTSSLAVLHARQLLHRDVSLRNLHCTHDQRCKLLDFGAMTEMGTVAARVGTPPYLAPEALQPEHTLDGRTDLFALGAALYALITGRHAYPAASFDELPAAWRRQPPAPHVLVPEVPIALSQLTMALLSLDVLVRPSSAAEVMERLSALSGVGLRESGEARRAFLSTPRLTGRARQAQQLRFFFGQATSLRPSVLAIRGPSGSGRTRMLELCIKEAQRAGLGVVEARGTDPHRAWGLVCALVERASACLPEAHAAGSGVTALLQEAKASRQELQAAAMSFWQELSAQRPLLLAVDDLDRADEPSIACLLALREAKGPLIAFSVASDRPVHARAAYDFLCQNSARIDLPSLTREQVQELLGSVFGDAPNVIALADRIHAASDGQPQWIMQLAEQLLEQGSVRYEAGAFRVPAHVRVDALPKTLSDALQARLALASPDARELAGMLMLDPEVWYEPRELADATGLPLLECQRHLSELVQRGVLARDRGRVGLKHGVPLTAAGHADDTTRRHARLAAIFERRGDLARHAQHLWRAGQQAAALQVLLAYCDAAQRGLPRDPTLMDRLIAAMPPDFISLLCAAIDQRDALGMSKREELSLRLMSLRIGTFTCHGSAREHARVLLTQLCDETGIADWEKLAHITDERERLERAQAQARARYAQTPPEARGYTVEEALAVLPGVSANAANVLSQTREFTLGELLWRTTAQIAPTPTLGVVRDVAAATNTLMNGRYEPALAMYRRILANLESDKGALVDPVVRRFNRLGSTYTIAHTAAERGQPAALEWADKLERELLFEVPAWRIRMAYYRALGDVAEMERCRRKAELLRIAQRPHEHYGVGAIGMELYQCLIAEDLLGAKRLRDELEALVPSFPGWTPLLEIARGEYARLLGEPARALVHFEASLARCRCGRDSTWQVAAAACLSALLDLNQLEAGKQRGRAFLAEADAAELHDSATWIVQRLALIEARAGEPERAIELAERALGWIREFDVSGTRAGLAHETRARVAIALADQRSFERHLAECSRHFRTGRSPALCARYERIVSDARASGMLPPPAAAGNQHEGHDLAELRSQLRACASAEQRAASVLSLLVRESSAKDGALYLADAGRLQLRALFGSTHWQSELDLDVMNAWRGPPDAPTPSTDHTLDLPQSASQPHGELQSCLLLHELEGELLVLGVAVLRGAISAPRLAALQLPRLCAQLLLEAGDASPTAIAAR